MNVLVFPCGSEVGLEVYESLSNIKDVCLFGASSVRDHGIHTYSNYFELPHIDEVDFVFALRQCVNRNKIDVIIPANDKVLMKLKLYEREVGCKVIGPDVDVVEICNNKRLTYHALKELVRVPGVYDLKHARLFDYPVFVKPEVGHSSIGCEKAENHTACFSLAYKKPVIICEYLPGKEYTVDCFSNQYFFPRERVRTYKGISVETVAVPPEFCEPFIKMGRAIYSLLKIDCAWFFQVKEDVNGKICLMEIGCRIAGSSALSRLRGYNLSEMNLIGFWRCYVPEPYCPIGISRSLSVKAIYRYE